MEDDTHSFIVRIWDAQENQEGKTHAWRGSIDYVGRNMRLYFYDLDSIVHFIQEQIEGNAMQSLSRWQALVRKIRDWWCARLERGSDGSRDHSAHP